MSDDEAARLSAVRATRLLDTAPEKAFDDIAKLASLITGMPIALIGLVDDRRVFFKAHHGLDLESVPRDESLCTHTIAQEGIFVVEDARCDDRFRENRFVLGAPHLRFYAGAPLVTSDGTSLGSLCVVDLEPRKLEPRVAEALRLLARQVTDQIELRARSIALARSEAQLADAQALAHVGSWEWDLGTGETRWSDELRNIYGVDASFDPDGFFELVHPDDRDALRAAFRAAMSKGSPAELDHRVVRPDGAVRYVQARGRAIVENGRPRRLAGTAQDITEQRRAEIALRESESTSRAMLTAIPDVMIVIGPDDTIVDHHVPSTYRIAASRPDGTGRPASDILPSELIDAVHACRRSRSMVHRELSIVNERGHFDREARVVPGDHGEVVLIIRDITERKELERMKAEFVSTVSHELRTPLTSIRGALGLVEGGVAGEASPEVRELVTIARSSCDRLIRLVNDILDLEKMESGKLTVKVAIVRANQLVAACLDSVRPLAAERNIELAVRTAPDLAFQGDEDRLVQVLTNLVSNAVKFSPEGARVRIEIEDTSDGVRFEVHDRGPGIAEVEQGKLFRRFQQLDGSDRRRHGGTGLGLAIAKAIVEAHRGTIGVESSQGEGSCFWFSIPKRVSD
jgi:PAS domain S-box-containing protein